MSKAPLAAYPALRLRRLRQADWIRRLVRETVLTPADLIWSVVVHEGEGQVHPGGDAGRGVDVAVLDEDRIGRDGYCGVALRERRAPFPVRGGAPAANASSSGLENARGRAAPTRGSRRRWCG